jgi:hypothetical protein
MRHEKLKPGYLLHLKGTGLVVKVLGDGPEPDTYRVLPYWPNMEPADEDEFVVSFDEFSGHYLGAS